MAAVMDLQTTIPEHPPTYIGRTVPVRKSPPTMGTLWSQTGKASVLPQSHEASKSASLAMLFGKLQSYRSLDEDWDGYGGSPATYKSFISAIEFLSSLSQRFDTPSPMLASDGEISLYWKTEDKYLEISFPGDGTYHYIYVSPTDRYASPDLPLNSNSINKNFATHLQLV